MCPPESAALSIPDLAHEDDSFVPSTPISKAAYKIATSLLHPAILNHSIRVYLYARAIAAAQGSPYHNDPAKHDLLFTSCILHDIGTTDKYNGDQRFEVDGADAAVTLLSQFAVSEEDKKDVWMAIALHTSRQIVQRLGGLCPIVRMAVEIDFGVTTRVSEIPDLVARKVAVETRFQRGDIEKVLGDAVVAQLIANPGKAPSDSWSGVMYQSYLDNPDWKGVNKAF